MLKSAYRLAAGCTFALALAGCSSIPARQALAPASGACASAASSSARTPVVAVLSQAGPSSPALDSARAGALSTIVAGATELQARLLLNDITSGTTATNRLDETMTAQGPNDLFRKQDMNCKRQAIATAASALAKQPRQGRVDLISALGALASQLQTAPQGPVNVAVLGSMLTTTQLASGTTLDLASPTALANPVRAINALARSGLNFRCAGWRVAAVDPSYTPEGAPLTAVQNSRLEAFWQAYFAHCGGTLAAWTTRLLTYPVSSRVAGPDASIITIARRPHLVLVTLHSDVAFALNSAVIEHSAAAELSSLIPVIDRARGAIAITGYTDNTGTAAINGPLSSARARSVARWIEANTAVPAARLEPAGLGASDPAAINSTAAGRARNRRVVIAIKTG